MMMMVNMKVIEKLENIDYETKCEIKGHEEHKDTQRKLVMFKLIIMDSAHSCHQVHK